MVRTGALVYITPLRQLIEELVGCCLYRLGQLVLNMEDMAAQVISYNQAGGLKLSKVFCQHFLRGRRDYASKLTETSRALSHYAENLYPPLPLKKADC